MSNFLGRTTSEELPLSLVVERARNPWLAAFAVLAIAPVLTVTFWGMQTVDVGSSAVQDSTARSITAPGWTQREWVTSVHRWSGDSRPTSEDIAAATAIVTDVYDTMLLEPASLAEAINTSFTREAQAELTGKKIGWPDGVSEVRIKSRRLEIGIQSGAADRAIAHLRISATGVASGRPVELWHRAQLWMEKDGGKWTIFAFDIRQAPLR